MDINKIGYFGKNYQEKTKFYYVTTLIRVITEIVGLVIVHIFKKFLNIFNQRNVKDISGQTALVTGGGNGLGKEICIQLAKKGCNVVVVDIDINAATEVAKELRANFNVKSKAYKMDVSRFDHVNDIGNQIEAEMGPVDILVNNAGVIPAASILDVDPIEVDRVLGVNLKSHFWTTQKFIRTMKDRNKGHIVAICSVAGIGPVARGILYAASKFGVKGFMDSLNSELLLDNFEIKTTTIFPFFIATNNDLMDFLNSMNTFTIFPPLLPTFVAEQTIQGIVNNREYVVLPSYFDKFLFIMQFIPKYIWLRAMYAGVVYKTRKVLAD